MIERDFDLQTHTFEHGSSFKSAGREISTRRFRVMAGEDRKFCDAATLIRLGLGDDIEQGILDALKSSNQIFALEINRTKIEKLAEQGKIGAFVDMVEARLREKKRNFFTGYSGFLELAALSGHGARVWSLMSSDLWNFRSDDPISERPWFAPDHNILTACFLGDPTLIPDIIPTLEDMFIQSPEKGQWSVPLWHMGAIDPERTRSLALHHATLQDRRNLVANEGLITAFETQHDLHELFRGFPNGVIALEEYLHYIATGITLGLPICATDAVEHFQLTTMHAHLKETHISELKGIDPRLHGHTKTVVKLLPWIHVLIATYASPEKNRLYAKLAHNFSIPQDTIDSFVRTYLIFAIRSQRRATMTETGNIRNYIPSFKDWSPGEQHLGRLAAIRHGILNDAISTALTRPDRTHILSLAKTGSRMNVAVGGRNHGIILNEVPEISRAIWEQLATTSPHYDRSHPYPGIFIAPYLGISKKMSPGFVRSRFCGYTLYGLSHLVEHPRYMELRSLIEQRIHATQAWLRAANLNHGHPHYGNFTVECIQKDYLHGKNPNTLTYKEGAISFNPLKWLEDQGHDKWELVVRAIDFDRMRAGFTL